MDGDDELHFCWDDSKAASNLEKHHVSFEAATYVFDDRNRLEQEDRPATAHERKDYERNIFHP